MPGGLEVSNCVVFYGALRRRHFRHLSRMDRSLARKKRAARPRRRRLEKAPAALKKTVSRQHGAVSHPAGMATKEFDIPP